MQFELNPQCSEVAKGTANLFKLQILYELDGVSGSLDATFEMGVFSMKYENIEPETNYTLTIVLYYNATEVERFSNIITTSG